MGNYMSCTLVPNMKNSKAARVIFPTGEVRQFREPIKAAELMLESPNFFLVNSRSLHIQKRFSALSADEDLEFGHVYIMFPMKRVNSVVTGADMAVLFLAANSAAKRISGGKIRRILPENGNTTNVNQSQNNGQVLSVPEEPRLKLDEIEGLSGQEFQYRLASCRSRKPTLETIREEPIGSR